MFDRKIGSEESVIRNSSASSVNQTSDVTRSIPWWRNVKPCQHHNKFKCSETNGYNSTLNFIEKKVP